MAQIAPIRSIMKVASILISFTALSVLDLSMRLYQPVKQSTYSLLFLFYFHYRLQDSMLSVKLDIPKQLGGQ